MYVPAQLKNLSITSYCKRYKSQSPLCSRWGLASSGHRLHLHLKTPSLLLTTHQEGQTPSCFSPTHSVPSSWSTAPYFAHSFLLLTCQISAWSQHTEAAIANLLTKWTSSSQFSSISSFFLSINFPLFIILTQLCVVCLPRYHIVSTMPISFAHHCISYFKKKKKKIQRKIKNKPWGTSLGAQW